MSESESAWHCSTQWLIDLFWVIVLGFQVSFVAWRHWLLLFVPTILLVAAVRGCAETSIRFGP